MADVWLGRFSRWIEKLVNAKGGPVLLDVSPSLQAVIPVQSGIDELFLQSVARYATLIGQAAVAAQQAFVQLRNPAGSGVVATVELIGVGPAVATTSTYHLTMQFGIGDGVVNTARGFHLDSRSNTFSTCIMSSGTAASADLASLLLAASGTNAVATGIINITQGLPIVLLPGDVVRIADQTVNEAFTVEMLWRERALESSETTA